MNRQITYATRKFGHSKIKWSISNYCISPSGLDWEIHSPDFVVDGVILTKWRMALKRSYVQDLNIWNNTFKLTRLEHRNFKEKVSAQCKLIIDKHVDDSVADIADISDDAFSIEFKHEFLANTAFEKELGIFEFTDFLQVMHLSHSNNLTFKLLILLTFEGQEEAVSFCNDLLIKELSDDLFFMYETANCFDINLRVGDEYIQAHQGLLYRRIKNRSIKEKLYDNNLITLDRNDNSDAYSNVLRFLYTGNMRHVLIEPNLNIYRSAKKLGVEPIITYYEPQKMHLHSTTEVEELDFTWTINDFFKRKERFLYSPELFGTKGIRCRLKLYPKSFGDFGEHNLGVFVQVEVEKEKEICIDLFIKRLDRKFCLKRFHKRVIGREIFGDRKIFERDDLDECFLPDGHMILYINIRIPTGKIIPFSGSSSCKSKPYSEQKNYEELSEDMLALYRHSDCSDFEINVEENNHLIEVHRYILHARHHCLFDSYLQSSETLICKLNKETMDHLLQFLYSGKIRGIIPIFCIAQLFEVAEEFNKFTLKYAVIKNIQENFHLFDYDYVHQLADFKNIMKMKVVMNNMDCIPIR